MQQKKKIQEILPFATTWMDLDGIMLSEILYDITYMWIPKQLNS